MSYKELLVIKSQVIPDLLVFEPSMSWDNRGNIYTSFNNEFYEPHLPQGVTFIHDKFAESKFNVLRGLHGDNKTWKLVSCVYGEILEVVVDMRRNSPTYKKWDRFVLKSDEYRQVLIPPGFVNGYYVMSERAVFHYKLAYLGDYIDAGDQITIPWNDPELGIEWPCDEPILQERDKKK
jgi:dTDP-4-dehydrorhamnose 3,5-epimerase